MTWDKENQWEKSWWGNCGNTFGEETKQISYAKYMGLSWRTDIYDGSKVWLNVKNVSVLDIGGGPCSILLKTRDVRGTVVDPCDYPEWTEDRYLQCGIRVLKMKAEGVVPNLFTPRFDECWIYNCLQHVSDPELIARNVLELARTIRIFEPVNVPISDGHPQFLTKERLDFMFNTDCPVLDIDENGFKATAYYGVIKGNLK
jgi:hypothetical protein